MILIDFFCAFRFQYLPLFLNRNLSYAKMKKWRPNKRKVKRRTSFKSNRLLEIIDRLTDEKCGQNQCVTFSFSGFYDKNLYDQSHAEIKVVHKQTNAQVIKTNVARIQEKKIRPIFKAQLDLKNHSLLPFFFLIEIVI